MSNPHSTSITTTIILPFLKSLWYFGLYPFVIAIYESLAFWRVFKFFQRSEQLRKLIRNCIVLNGLVFLGSICFYTYILAPLFHLLLTTFNTHLCQNWYFSNPIIDFTQNNNQNMNDMIIDTNICGFTITETMLSIIYNICWTIPIYLVSLVANGLWHNKIVEEMGKLHFNTDLATSTSTTTSSTTSSTTTSTTITKPEQNQQLTSTVNHNNNQQQQHMNETNTNTTQFNQQQNQFNPQLSLPNHQSTPDSSSSSSPIPPPPVYIPKFIKFNNQPLYSENDSKSKLTKSTSNTIHSHQQQPLTSTQQQQRDAVLSPLPILSVIPEQISRICIFLLLLIQATILSFITVPSIFPTKLIESSTIIATINTFVQNIPLILSYALTSISYTYAMFEYTWSSPKLLQLMKNELYSKPIINQQQQQQQQLLLEQQQQSTTNQPSQQQQPSQQHQPSQQKLPPTQLQIMEQLYILREEDVLTQLNHRFGYTERRVSYFIGFSFLLTIFTFSLPFLLSISIFNIIFPFNLLTALVAHSHIDMLDIPLLPLRPIPSPSQQQQFQQSQQQSQQQSTNDTTLAVIYHTHDLYVPKRIPILTLARWMNDNVFMYLHRKLNQLKRR